MLFPWARCVVWCVDTGATMLAPRWFKLRLGPYLRREPDKRRYDRLFRSNSYKRGPAKMATLLRARAIDETTAPGLDPNRILVVRFSGLADYFAPFVGKAGLVRTELRRITRPNLVPTPAETPFMAVHVRLGDFPRSWRQPLDWYGDAVVRARTDLGRRLRVRVYSDGRADELQPLLSHPGVEYVQGRTAITDLLDLAQASAIVASSSTFSMWGAFLGEVPTIWYPGRMWQSATQDPQLQVEWGGDTPLPESFVSGVARRLAPDQTRGMDA
jgi:hypothetical protein